MGNYRFDNSETSTLAPQPHFDDERTLLSARPVVPLEKINTRVKHRKHWFLGGAFALAMMLGAASALLASYLKLRNAEQAISQVEVAMPLPVAAAVPSAPDEIAELEPVTRPKKEPAPKLKATEKASASFTPEPESKKVSEEEELERIREAVLVDQWQERRARRVLRQERRRNRVDRYNHRDLSNLDEIFEGRRRPQRP